MGRYEWSRDECTARPSTVELDTHGYWYGTEVRAAVIASKTLGLQQAPDPKPGSGEVLIRVRAAGLNNADLMQIAGMYPAPPGSPADIPGLELAGEVVEVGPNAFRFAVGDRVMAVVGGGALAELAVCHERTLLPVPEAVDWASAGGFPEAFTTAHDALFTQCNLHMGERLLVHGAAGGVGSAAVQLGVAAGAVVVGTVRSEVRRAQVAALGATVLDPEEFEGAGPFDVVLELVGAAYLAGNLRALNITGRISIIGVSGSGGRTETEQRIGAGLVRRAKGHGCPSSGDTSSSLALHRKDPRAYRGNISLADVAAAYEAFKAGSKFGKFVCLMD